MEPVKRIIVNTAAQYVKALVNIVLSLYSTRLILSALTIPDYGIYAVVGGVVAMLGFITNALVITTQRYVSYHQGNGNYDYVRKLFVNSLFLHVLIGLGLSAILYSLKGWLMDDVLNIPFERIQTAGRVYEITILMLFITVVTAPFKALFIARENIIYISVVEVMDGFLKLFLAIGLAFVNTDKLLVYALCMALILFFNLAAFVIYALWRFEECVIIIRRVDIDRECLRRLLGFAGWTTYGMGAVAGRNQGISVMFNHFMGTVVNAAYGISFQVYGAVSFVATSILNAMNPQIMKAEGANDRAKMLLLAEQESKYSTALMSMLAIPLVMEMPALLDLWLEEVPEGTSMFCRYVLIAFLCDQTTYGLNTANQALGNIRNYTLLVYTPKILIMPLVWLLLSDGYDTQSVMRLYLGVEILVALARIPYLKYTAGLSIRHYFNHVICPLLPLCTVLYVTSLLCTVSCVSSYRFLLTFSVSILSGLVVAWLFTLDEIEKIYVRTLIGRRIYRD